MLKVVCIERKKGEYQGFNYDNYLIHTIDNVVNNDNCKGTKTKIIKLKSKDIADMNPMLWLGKEIEVFYDEHQKPIHINVQ